VAAVPFVARWKSWRSVASLRAAIDLIRLRGVANSAAVAAVANLIKLVGIFAFLSLGGGACARQSTFAAA
jgi:hypothetical protein